MKPAVNLEGGESTFWMKCTRPHCRTYVNTYIPMEHQYLLHMDSSRYSGVFGGYGTGKTTNCMMDDEKHFIITPRGKTLIGSKVLAQVEQTLEKDLQSDFPLDFLKKRSVMKKFYDFVNGHRLYIRPMDDEGKIRSLNLSRFHLVEGSEVAMPLFTQSQNRLRNTAAMTFEMDEDGNTIIKPETGKPIVKSDWRKGLVESNPSNTWIRNSFLLTSARIFLLGSSQSQDYYVPPEKSNTYFSSYIVPTDANYHLPPDFYSEQAAGKPRWWVRRYLEGSFDYSEGQVYPEFLTAVCRPFPIPATWRRCVGLDYGINDLTAILFGAIDPIDHVLYIYKEITTHDMNYKSISKLYKDYVKDPMNLPYGSVMFQVMDAKSYGKRNDYDLQTMGQLFANEGLFFSPAKMDLETRIVKTNTLIELEQLKIFNTCTNLIEEGISYKFPEKQLDRTTRADINKPVDKNNHSISSLEFIVMELPHDLRNFDNAAYDGSGNVIRAYYSQEAIQNAGAEEVFNPFEDTNTDSFYEDDDSIWGRW